MNYVEYISMEGLTLAPVGVSKLTEQVCILANYMEKHYNVEMGDGFPKSPYRGSGLNLRFGCKISLLVALITNSYCCTITL